MSQPTTSRSKFDSKDEYVGVRPKGSVRKYFLQLKQLNGSASVTFILCRLSLRCQYRVFLYSSGRVLHQVIKNRGGFDYSYAHNMNAATVSSAG